MGTMAVDRQVVLVFGAESEGRVLAVDLHTGATLNTYRGNCSSPGAAVIIGSDHFAAAQSDKKAIHAWAWHKDAVVTRSFLSEHASALATSPCGTYLVAGGASGYIHLWETSTGQLLR